VDQSKFEALTKALVTEGPRRGFLGAIAGGTLGLLLGVSAEDAEAGPRRRAKRKKKKGQNRCKGVDRICQPFESGKCCSKRCCPALGSGRHVSVCAPNRASQCCPKGLGGGYCDRPNYRKCCKPSPLSPDGYCCPSVGSSCCDGNLYGQDKDYCCPPDSRCCSLAESSTGCCPKTVAATGVSASGVVAAQAAGSKAG
jgi:hypothetical protein